MALPFCTNDNLLQQFETFAVFRLKNKQRQAILPLSQRCCQIGSMRVALRNLWHVLATVPRSRPSRCLKIEASTSLARLKIFAIYRSIIFSSPVNESGKSKVIFVYIRITYCVGTVGTLVSSSLNHVPRVHVTLVLRNGTVPRYVVLPVI